MKMPKVVFHCGECGLVMRMGPKGAICANKHCPQHAAVIPLAALEPEVA